MSEEERHGAQESDPGTAASGLQDRANIEGVIAAIAAIAILGGIGLGVRTWMSRRKGPA